MAKKDFDFFEGFKSQMDLCRKAAKQLAEMLTNYTDVPKQADEIHNTEHEADKALHRLMNELNRSFITPIDREDIVNLANMLDNITDSIEDVSNLFDILSIKEVMPEARSMAALVVEACDCLYSALSEFPRFKNSKTLNDMIIKVNHVEEAGDKMHRGIIKSMYLNEKDAIEIMKWKEIFDMLETVLDECEDVADLLFGLAIKNS